MGEMMDALISIHGVHAHGILQGSKTVELRRRFPRTQPGSRLWIYETLPTAAVTGHVEVVRLERDVPEVLWARHERRLGISRAVFEAYLSDCTYAYAIMLSAPQRVVPIPAASLKSIRPGFHPPQVMTRLSSDEGRIMRSMVQIPGIDQDVVACDTTANGGISPVQGSTPPHVPAA